MDEDLLEHLIPKGKRARRRELEAVREPGRLRKWFGNEWGSSGVAWKQTARAWASRAVYYFHVELDMLPCGVDKRQWRQNERHAVRQQCRKLITQVEQDEQDA